MVALASILGELPGAVTQGALAGDVDGVTYRSAEVTPGALFVAIPGKWRDGHDFIPEALARGAVAIIGERPAPMDLPDGRVYARVADARLALGLAAAAYYGHPTRRIMVVGVTGTDGKTTTTNLVEALLAGAGRRTGMMSTVDFKIGERRWDNASRFTTLEAPEVQTLLADMAMPAWSARWSRPRPAAWRCIE